MDNLPSRIPRTEWAAFVLDADGEPVNRAIQDLEEFQIFVLETLPAAIGLAPGETVILSADVAEAAGVFADAPGMQSTLDANATYLVEGLLTFRSAGVGVGIGLAFTLPVGATINGGWDHFITAVTKGGGYNNASGVVSGNTGAVPVANDNNPITGRWIIKTAAAEGIAQLRFRSSAAATAVTLKKDLTNLVFRKIG